jgi:glycosyltransferase involved in cell wall biosynthesis
MIRVLTGLYHLIHGLDRSRFAPAMILYEGKKIEADLSAIDVPIFHVHRRSLPKVNIVGKVEDHALRKDEDDHRAKIAKGLGTLLRKGRHWLRLTFEEAPTILPLVRLLRRVRPDVVHLGNGVRANYDGVLACLLTRTPCVCHIKGFEKYSARERWIAPRIDALVFMTRALEEYCRQYQICGRRMQVVYDAVDEAAFAPRRLPAAVRAELGVKNGAPCLGVVGNIQEWKGQTVLVEAMARVVAAVPTARGFIIGGVHRAGIAYKQQLDERIRALQLDGAVSVTGFRTDVADVMNALDVVVHTSVRPEPFGRVILEAMLLAKPVVATAAGGVPELIRDGETGFLTPPGDPEHLAARLISLLQDPVLRRRVGERAQAEARQQFSLSKHVDEMSAIYEDLTGRH